MEGDETDGTAILKYDPNNPNKWDYHLPWHHRRRNNNKNSTTNDDNDDDNNNNENKVQDEEYNEGYKKIHFEVRLRECNVETGEILSGDRRKSTCFGTYWIMCNLHIVPRTTTTTTTTTIPVVGSDIGMTYGNGGWYTWN